MVVSGADVTEEQAEEIFQRELKRISRKFTHMRYHSFLMYFGVLKRLGWVESTEETEASAIQDNYSAAPERTYYRLTKKGIEAGTEYWSNPLFTLYPEIGPSHIKKPD
jgi:DNA-binding PadR family transcriptional regulator